MICFGACDGVFWCELWCVMVLFSCFGACDDEVLACDDYFSLVRFGACDDDAFTCDDDL